MPLSNDSHFGTNALTVAINNLPVNQSTIRGLGIFKPVPINTTSVSIDVQDGLVSLVTSKPYGAVGTPVKTKTAKSYPFEVPHLPQDDTVLASEVQNVREFGTNKPLSPTTKVNDKLAGMKSNLEYTREHLMLGALQGKIYDGDGELIVDIYERFGIDRKVYEWALSDKDTDVNKLIDSMKIDQGAEKKGESVKSWVVLASRELMESFIYHNSIQKFYENYQTGATKYLGDTELMFEHKNIKFVDYSEPFGTEADINEGEGLLLPIGTKNTFDEYFAPADMDSAVNTLGKPYYASREKLKHGKGWELHSQSNALPMVKRPSLLATIKMI